MDRDRERHTMGPFGVVMLAPMVTTLSPLFSNTKFSHPSFLDKQNLLGLTLTHKKINKDLHKKK